MRPIRTSAVNSAALRNLDFCRNGKAAITPGLQAAGERPNALYSPLPQRERDARARELARTATIEDDLLRGWYYDIPVLLKPAGVYANRTGNRHPFGSGTEAALQIHKQNIFACIQLVPELFWSDPRKFELTHEALQAHELADHVEGESCYNSERHKGSRPRYMSGNAV